MVSDLWKACSEGDLQKVNELLVEASIADIEVKDQDGMTPLIEAVKNGHLEVVKVLLEKGADPLNSSHQGLPEQHTADPTIIEAIRARINPQAFRPPHPGYPMDPNVDPSKAGYYMPPPVPYGYYPGMPVPPLPEGAVPYYPPPAPPAHPTDEQSHGGQLSNLPPPEIARLIPCRYFPTCRYGASCMFAHPQGPYYQGSMPPPAQYPTHYEPMSAPPYAPNFYQMPPPSFAQPPNGIHPPHMTPLSPQSGMQSPPAMPHARSNSEIVSPSQPPFTPNGAPAPAIPVPYPISPISPSYSQSGQAPLPLSMPPPVNSVPQPNGMPQSPPVMYPTQPTAAPNPSVNGYDPRRNSISQYPPVPPAQRAPEVNGMQRSPPLVADPYGPNGHRDGMGHHRRGSGLRKPPFAVRKPPCLFYPSGRCKNGSDCRFPHVMPDSAPMPHQPPHFATRGRFRPPHFMNGFHAANGVNGHETNGSIEEKFAALTVRENNVPPRRPEVTGTNGNGGSPDAANRARLPPVPKPVNGPVTNGPRPVKPIVSKQRVPNADEFPVLGGSTTPPAQSPGINGHMNGLSGPTAAQVLRAPPPARKDSYRDTSTSSRSQTPESAQPTHPSKPASEVNHTSTSASLQEPVVNKLPVSFAAVANGAPDAAKEVFVSA